MATAFWRMSSAPPPFVITPHARSEMLVRDIDEPTVRRVLSEPEQRIPIRPGREVFQSRIQIGNRYYLLRVFVDVNRIPVEVVTAYRTSKIAKYWRPSP